MTVSNPNVRNLTPHIVTVYDEKQFISLVQKNATTWVADGVEGDPVAAYEPEKESARIAVSTVPVNSPLPGTTVKTVYGEAAGIPDGADDTEVLVVSLFTQSTAKTMGLPSATQMVAPYKVVRDAANGSIVLGCMGFTY